MTLDYTFSNVGGPIAIARPAQIWTTFTSKRFKYSDRAAVRLGGGTEHRPGEAGHPSER